MTHVQIRNVSTEAHEKLKKRAAKKGMSLSEYLRLEIERIASLPTWEELSERINRRGRVSLGVDVAEMIRADRESR